MRRQQERWSMDVVYAYPESVARFASGHGERVGHADFTSFLIFFFFVAEVKRGWVLFIEIEIENHK